MCFIPYIRVLPQNKILIQIHCCFTSFYTRRTNKHYYYFVKEYILLKLIQHYTFYDTSYLGIPTEEKNRHTNSEMITDNLLLNCLSTFKKMYCYTLQYFFKSANGNISFYPNFFKNYFYLLLIVRTKYMITNFNVLAVRKIVIFSLYLV